MSEARPATAEQPVIFVVDDDRSSVIRMCHQHLAQRAREAVG